MSDAVLRHLEKNSFSSIGIQGKKKVLKTATNGLRLKTIKVFYSCTTTTAMVLFRENNIIAKKHVRWNILNKFHISEII